MAEKRKLAFYIRLSDADEEVKEGTKDESNSITGQRKLLYAYIKKTEEFAGFEVLEYFDDGYSGTMFNNRAEFQRLIQDAELGRFECIIVKDFSRFGRDYLEVGNYLAFVFPAMGMRFISVNDNYDSDRNFGVTGGMDVAYKNLIYQLYSMDLSRKVKSARRTRNLSGEYTASFVCYGYKKDPDDKHKLLKDSSIPHDQVKHHVQKWFVLSTLTGRYVGSPESVMSRDIRLINEKGFINFFYEIEASVLSDTFWDISLPQNLETTSTNSPAFNTFLAAQINLNCNSLFMHGTMISDLINISGDVHHIFPKAYLKNNGIDTKGRYNQVANFTYLDTQVNKAISDDAPNIYFQSALEQCDKKNIAFGNIFERDALMKNLSENAIPESIVSMTVENYDDFLADRRKLMAQLMMRYYKGL